MIDFKENKARWDEIRKTEYQKRIKFFHHIMDKFDEPYLPVGVNGYSPEEEQILILTLAACGEPNLLQLSECPHRAVVACLAVYYKNFDNTQIEEITRRHEGPFCILKSKTNPNGRIIISFGYNNWQQIKENNLNCKPVPGMPHEVPQESLNLEDRSTKRVGNLSEVDNACLKRTKKLACHITHAERSVITNTLTLLRNLHLGQADKTILATTWTPCIDCFNLIVEHSEIYGINIDTFSLFSAVGDADDREMNQRIRETLDQGQLGELHGPYIGVSKENGYGWYPSREATVNEVRGYLPERGLAIDPKMKKLLARTFNILYEIRKN